MLHSIPEVLFFFTPVLNKTNISKKCVGFLWQVLAEEMPGGELSVEVRNRVGEGQLNEGCGAEWVQKVRGRTDTFLLC